MNYQLDTILNQIDAVIFDLDGTLVDSMWVWSAVDRDYFHRYGMEVPEGLQQDIAGMSFSETAVYFKEHFPMMDSVEDMKRIWNEMAETKYATEVLLKPGAKEFLQKMKARGIKTGVATSNSEHLVHLVLKAQEVDELMDSVHTACEVKKGKPSPDIYLLVAEDLQVKPERCLIFEDILEGLQAGISAGMKTCAVHDWSAESIWDEKQAMADYAILDYTELLD